MNKIKCRVNPYEGIEFYWICAIMLILNVVFHYIIMRMLNQPIEPSGPIVIFSFGLSVILFAFMMKFTSINIAVKECFANFDEQMYIEEIEKPKLTMDACQNIPLEAVESPV